MVGCSSESSQENSQAKDDGYIDDNALNEEFESSETDSLDEDMDLNWI